MEIRLDKNPFRSSRSSIQVHQHFLPNFSTNSPKSPTVLQLKNSHTNPQLR